MLLCSVSLKSWLNHDHVRYWAWVPDDDKKTKQRLYTEQILTICNNKNNFFFNFLQHKVNKSYFKRDDQILEIKMWYELHPYALLFTIFFQYWKIGWNYLAIYYEGKKIDTIFSILFSSSCEREFLFYILSHYFRPTTKQWSAKWIKTRSIT